MCLIVEDQVGNRVRYAVVIGDSASDIMATSYNPLRSYVPGRCHGIVHKRGGCARNVAENLARLGADVRLMSVFGDDAPGRSLMDMTLQAGVDLSASRVCSGLPTACCLIINDHRGEHFCMISDHSITDALTAEWLSRWQALMHDASLIIANTTLSAASLGRIFHPDFPPVFVDTVSIDRVEVLRPWLSRVHTLKCSRSEASHLSQCPFSSRDQAPAVAEWFHRQGVARVVFSLGEFGAYYSSGMDAGWVAPLPVSVVDVTGAGDALMAGLAYGWLNDQSFVDAVHFAAGCAAMTLACVENNHLGLSPHAVKELIGSLDCTH